MRWLLGVLMLASCSPIIHAYTVVHPKRGIVGERRIRLAVHDDEAEILEPLLRARGFRVARDVPGGAIADAPFTLSADGTCSSWGGASLKIDLFRVSDSERIFESQMSDNGDCPEAFFREAVVELARQWR